MWSRLLTCALLLLPAPALAGAKEKVAALAPSWLVLVMDAEGNELMAQNADKPFAQEQWPIAFRAAPRHREWALTETRCPLWVIRRHDGTFASRLLYPR